MGIPDRPSGQTPIKSEEEGKQDRTQSGDTCVVMSIYCRIFRIPGLDPGSTLDCCGGTDMRVGPGSSPGTRVSICLSAGQQRGVPPNIT